MTFTCANIACDKQETCVDDHIDAIKEDLEVILLDKGWIYVRSVAGEVVLCSVYCLAMWL